MESGQCCNGAAEHAHGVGVVSEGVHHGEKILVDEGVLHHFFTEGVEFFLGGEFSPKDQIGDLEEGAFFG